MHALRLNVSLKLFALQTPDDVEIKSLVACTAYATRARMHASTKDIAFAFPAFFLAFF